MTGALKVWDGTQWQYASGPAGSAVNAAGAPSNPFDGELWYDNDDPGGVPAMPQWQAWVPTLTNFTASSSTTRFIQQGKLVSAYGYFAMATFTGVFVVTLPVAASALVPLTLSIGTWSVLDVGTTRYNGTVQLRDANSFYFFPDGPAGSPVALSNTLPHAWAAGDQLGFSITYEAA